MHSIAQQLVSNELVGHGKFVRVIKQREMGGGEQEN